MDPQKQAIHSYIDQQRDKGISDEAIEQKLLTSGWPADLVRQALAEHGSASPVPRTDTAVGDKPAPAGASPGFFSGRIGRLQFLVGNLYSVSFFLIPIALEFLTAGNRVINILSVLLGIIGVILILPLGISLHIRRWHDRNLTGWLCLLSLIPFIGFIEPILLLALPGTPDANTYGPPSDGDLSPRGIFGIGRSTR